MPEQKHQNDRGAHRGQKGYPWAIAEHPAHEPFISLVGELKKGLFANGLAGLDVGQDQSLGHLIEDKDYDTLVETITTTVKPQSWDEVGGPGSVSEVPKSKCLVISQTRDVHDEVLTLLRALRAAGKVSTN